ncbi:MAG: hypothetical protein CMM49_01230 [Rhodospirillaceae bacterium]|nr:hypothetical protein [Rhodospirillaceae bacterium]|tara:strand:- start:8737 stop:9426 length:690 start_codon:yes stop_codon:yes gene_type:complete
MRLNTLNKILSFKKENKSFVVIRDFKSNKDFFYFDNNFDKENEFDIKFKLQCSNALKKDKSSLISYNNKEYFLYVFNSPLKLIIIGAVHIASSLIEIAQILDYKIILIDPRESFLNSQQFLNIETISKWPDEALKEIYIDNRTAIVTLSHDPKLDEPALIEALKSKAFYIGALGSKKTHEKRVIRLLSLGLNEDDINKINAPIGLPIGSVSTKEISISILAEITQKLRA